MYHVYLLEAIDANKTYIGMTNDPMYRFEQHNRERSGGAAATAGYKWKHVLILSGFPSRRDALQFEWYWKHISKRKHGVIAKLNTFIHFWIRGFGTTKSIPFDKLEKMENVQFYVSFSPAWLEKLKKIERFKILEGCLLSATFKISEYVSFQLFPFKTISKMSSNSSNTLVESVPAAGSKKKMMAKAAAPEPTAESVSVVPVTTEEKKPRKPKAASVVAAAVVDEATAATDSEKADAKEKKPRMPKTVAVAMPAAAATAPAAAAAEAAAVTDSEEKPVEKPAKEKKPRKPRVKKDKSAPAALDLDNMPESLVDQVLFLKDCLKELSGQVAALLSRPVSDSDGSDSEGKKKQRKKREPKPKATCPTASDGTIRFHATLKNDFKPLSNFHKAEITIDSVAYPTVEHYYQCAKFLETAPDYAERIRTTSNPALIKNMGRTLKVASRDDWEATHMDVMRKALAAKFEQHPDLAELLRSTGTATLEEESPTDAFWGIGADGNGTNHLGHLLAELRAGL